jgi:hypothetical protein
MAMRVLHKRCGECDLIIVFRRPSMRNIALILPHLPCHYCHPEKLKDCCISCRFPLSSPPTSTKRTARTKPKPGTVFRHSSKNICETCFVGIWRRKHAPQPLQTPAGT